MVNTGELFSSWEKQSGIETSCFFATAALFHPSNQVRVYTAVYSLVWWIIVQTSGDAEKGVYFY